MIDARGPYRNGAFFLAISAVLHIVAPVSGGFVPESLGLPVIGVVYLFMAFGLMQGWRWLAYLTFLILMLGSIVALWSSFGVSPVPSWLYFAIFMVNWCGVIALFLALWRSHPVET